MKEQSVSDKRFETKTSPSTAINELNIFANPVKKYQDDHNNNWLEISDPAATNLIMNTLGDVLNRQILGCVTSEPKTVMKIVSECKIPQTTGYSKIMGLIEYRFLIPYDTVQKIKGRQVNRYFSTLKELRIGMSESYKITIQARLSEFLQNQSIM